MSTKEIIEGINKLSFTEKIRVIEKVLKTLHESRDSKLEEAAKLLSSDYKRGKNLTAFTSLDFEKFYESK
jgi:hypothetical protein